MEEEEIAERPSLTPAEHLVQFMPLEKATELPETIAELPVGTVTAREAHPSEPMVSFRTQENRTLSHYGLEMGFYARPRWTFGTNYTFRTPNFFKAATPQLDDISLNAPKHKFGASVKYKNDVLGMDGKLRLRMQSKVHILASALGSGVLEGYTILDLAGGYKLPLNRRLKLTMSIQNLLDMRH